MVRDIIVQDATNHLLKITMNGNDTIVQEGGTVTSDGVITDTVITDVYGDGGNDLKKLDLVRGKVYLFQEFMLAPTGNQTVAVQSSKFSANYIKEYTWERKT